MPKDKSVKCGFCNYEMETPKELVWLKFEAKKIIVCPNCKSVLGVYFS